MTVVKLTKYLVTVTTNGYGEFGNPRCEIMRKEVDAGYLECALDDAALIGGADFQEHPTKRLTITVERI